MIEYRFNRYKLKEFRMTFKQMTQKIPRWMLVYYSALGLWISTTAMHIPDGYLSPLTSIIMFALVLPFWAQGAKKLREKMTAKNIPVVALFAAFSFVIMMFNVPLPGGTSGHAVGGALAAIILGPEIAVIAISIALVIQAFFFGDGGILSIGANSFNMAVVLPYTAYAVYQWITRGAALSSQRRMLGAVVAGWAGLSVSAFFTAFEFGIQPLLFHTADGTPLYAPYPLSVSIPAMVIPHLLVASVVEGLVTGLVVAYLMRANPGAFQVVNKLQVAEASAGLAKWRGAWAGLAILALLTPLGLLAPGTAWGEWGTQELGNMGLSFIPQGMQQISGLWAAPMAGYAVPTMGNETVGYVLSALTGILIVVGVAWLFSFLATNGAKNTPKATSGD